MGFDDRRYEQQQSWLVLVIKCNRTHTTSHRTGHVQCINRTRNTRKKNFAISLLVRNKNKKGMKYSACNESWAEKKMKNIFITLTIRRKKWSLELTISSSWVILVMSKQVRRERGWEANVRGTSHANLLTTTVQRQCCARVIFFLTLLFLLVFWWLKTGNVRVHFLYFFFIYVDARRQRASGTPFRLRYAALIYDQSFMVLRDCACVNKSTCRMTLA